MALILNEMPPIAKCDVSKCGYNVNNGCHAKAITIGDGLNPGCDTYFETKDHNRNIQRSAGVGACKVDACQNNQDYEFMAASISVGMVNGQINCLTCVVKS